VQQTAVGFAPLAHVLRAEPKLRGAQLAVQQHPEAARPRTEPEHHLRTARRAAWAQDSKRKEHRERHEGGDNEQGLQQRPDQADAFAAGLGLQTLIILSFRGDDSIDSSPACLGLTWLHNVNKINDGGWRWHEAFVTSP